MADGADQLVTEVALEQGCDIHVVLPKPYDVYRAELSDKGATQLDKLVDCPSIRVSTVSEATGRESDGVDTGLPYRCLGVISPGAPMF
jgi:hypothetical protein